MSQVLLEIKQKLHFYKHSQLTTPATPKLGVIFSFTYREWDLKDQAW